MWFNILCHIYDIIYNNYIWYNLFYIYIYIYIYDICTAHQAPLSMGFSRQEYWSGLPFPFPGDLPNPGMDPGSPALQVDSLPLSHQGSPYKIEITIKRNIICHRHCHPQFSVVSDLADSRDWTETKSELVSLCLAWLPSLVIITWIHSLEVQTQSPKATDVLRGNACTSSVKPGLSRAVGRFPFFHVRSSRRGWADYKWTCSRTGRWAEPRSAGASASSVCCLQPSRCRGAGGFCPERGRSRNFRSEVPDEGSLQSSILRLVLLLVFPFCKLQIRAIEVAQSCPTLCDPTDYSPTGSSLHGIFQARALEWVAISFSRGSSQPRDRTLVSSL